jgi:hypothetical protein
MMTFYNLSTCYYFLPPANPFCWENLQNRLKCNDFIPGLNMTVMAAQMKLHPVTTALQLETAVIYAKK